MSQTIELPDDLAAALAEEALRVGMSLDEYTAGLLASARAPSNSVPNGQPLLAYWESAGVVGTRTDVSDSDAEARKLREQAQRRGA